MKNIVHLKDWNIKYGIVKGVDEEDNLHEGHLKRFVIIEDRCGAECELDIFILSNIGVDRVERDICPICHTYDNANCH